MLIFEFRAKIALSGSPAAPAQVCLAHNMYIQFMDLIYSFVILCCFDPYCSLGALNVLARENKFPQERQQQLWVSKSLTKNLNLPESDV